MNYCGLCTCRWSLSTPSCPTPASQTWWWSPAASWRSPTTPASNWRRTAPWSRRWTAATTRLRPPAPLTSRSWGYKRAENTLTALFLQFLSVNISLFIIRFFFFSLKQTAHVVFITGEERYVWTVRVKDQLWCSQNIDSCRILQHRYWSDYLCVLASCLPPPCVVSESRTQPDRTATGTLLLRGLSNTPEASCWSTASRFLPADDVSLLFDGFTSWTCSTDPNERGRVRTFELDQERVLEKHSSPTYILQTEKQKTKRMKRFREIHPEVFSPFFAYLCLTMHLFSTFSN